MVHKVTSVFLYASVLLLIRNFVITLTKSPSGSADYFDNVMTKFIVNSMTSALKTHICRWDQCAVYILNLLNFDSLAFLLNSAGEEVVLFFRHFGLVTPSLFVNSAVCI